MYLSSPAGRKSFVLSVYHGSWNQLNIKCTGVALYSLELYEGELCEAIRRSNGLYRHSRHGTLKNRNLCNRRFVREDALWHLLAQLALWNEKTQRYLKVFWHSCPCSFWYNPPLSKSFIIPYGRLAFGKQSLKSTSSFLPCISTKAHEMVKRSLQRSMRNTVVTHRHWRQKCQPFLPETVDVHQGNYPCVEADPRIGLRQPKCPEWVYRLPLRFLEFSVKT